MAKNLLTTKIKSMEITEKTDGNVVINDEKILSLNEKIRGGRQERRHPSLICRRKNGVLLDETNGGKFKFQVDDDNRNEICRFFVSKRIQKRLVGDKWSFKLLQSIVFLVIYFSQLLLVRVYSWNPSSSSSLVFQPQQQRSGTSNRNCNINKIQRGYSIINNNSPYMLLSGEDFFLPVTCGSTIMNKRTSTTSSFSNIASPLLSRKGGTIVDSSSTRKQQRGVLGFDVHELQSTRHGNDPAGSSSSNSNVENDYEKEMYDFNADSFVDCPSSVSLSSSASSSPQSSPSSKTSPAFFSEPRLTWKDSPLSLSTDTANTATLIPEMNNNAANVRFVHYSTSSSSPTTLLPAWFPWVPTKDQITSLKLKELREACSQRGLIKSGNKDVLKERLLKWANEYRNTQRRNSMKIDSLFQGTNFKSASSIFRRRRLRQKKKAEKGSDEMYNSEENHNQNDIGIKNSCSAASSSDSSSISFHEEIITNDTPVFNSDTPNSLAEWTRKVDSAKFTKKRQEIHRKKRLGKKPPLSSIDRNNNNNRLTLLKGDDTGITKSSNLKKEDTTAKATKEYLLKLTNAMKSSPSSSVPYASSNKEVKELYDASKKADQLGEPLLAIRLLESLLRVTPNDARIYRRLSRMHREQGNLRSARSTLQNGLRQLPNNPWLWHGLGQFELSYGENTDNTVAAAAIECFKRAIKEDITFAHSYHAWGVHEFSNGRIAKSMKILKKGIEYCPTNHRLHHALGDIYRGAKLLKDAERSYRRALEEGPRVSNGFAYSALACVAYERGNIDEARRWLYKSIESNDGRHAKSWLALAQIEEAEGNFDKALMVCEASIIRYEKGLIASRRRYKKANQNCNNNNKNNNNNGTDKSKSTPTSRTTTLETTIEEGMLKSIPKYRSGDKFLSIYRHWARLEGRYGTYRNTNCIYERASTAFPYEYKISLDWARYHSKLRNVEKARSLFTEACNRASSRYNNNQQHNMNNNNNIRGADSCYREYASFEMSIGQFERARNILFLGAQKIIMRSSSSSFDTGDDISISGNDSGNNNNNKKYNNIGIGQLFVTWAVCEWHLQNIPRAEVLFDHALQLTKQRINIVDDDDDGSSELRSFILYCMALMEYHEREEIHLAQHCIGLCLKENSLPGDDHNAPVWDLWATIAREMNNLHLENECVKEASKCRNNNTNCEIIDDGMTATTGHYGSSSSSALETMNKLRGSQRMKNWMRQEPWHDKLQSVRGSTNNNNNESSEFYATIQIPDYNKNNKKFNDGERIENKI